VFEVNINEQNSDFTMFRSGTGLEAEATNRQISSRQLIAATEQQIEGARVVEYWHHNQQHLVLVALERDGAEQRLRQKIGQLDQQITGLAGYADDDQLNSVVRIGALEQARQLQQLRTPLNRNLSVVSGKQVASSITIAMLQKRIRNQLARLRFRLDAGEELLPSLQHAVGQIGGRAHVDAALSLRGTLEREPVTQQQGWYWLRGSLQLALSGADGKVIAQRRWPIKISAQQRGLIEQRLQDQINNDIADQLYQLLTSTRASAGQ
jgi:hypothetical protein